MKNYKNQIVAYDVSGGDSNFDSIPFDGKTFLAVQLFYTSLNQADHTLKLQESLDGVNFIDALDTSGTAIELTIDNSLTTDILKVYDYNTAHIRFQFIEGTTGTGTIDKLMILSE